MMKVLWFSNTMANADEYFNSEVKRTGGWLKALDQSLQNHVELHIAFYKQYDHPFKYGKTFYHPIRPKSIFRKVINRLFSIVSYEEEIKKYFEIINKVNPDIIHIHGTEEPFASVIPETVIPVVVSIQGNTTVVVHKYFSGLEKRYLKFSNRKINSLKDIFFPESFSANYKWYLNMRRLEKINLRSVKNIMGRTDWDRRITRILAPGSDYFHEDRVLRDSFYNRQWLPQNRDKILIHTTLSNNFYKGFETLCQALTELKDLNINCEWRVAGIDPTDLIVKVTKKKLKNRYPLEGLILLGSLNEQDLVDTLLMSDIYVMTSHIENNANNLCEAMMLGMPCISTFVGGMGSLIKDGEHGILIQGGDPWAMAGAVLELVNDRDNAVRIGKNARAIALIRHDKNRIVNDLLIAYNTIINKDLS
jgi:glycosyltransferase involved in cell wall biosynthesis